MAFISLSVLALAASWACAAGISVHRLDVSPSAPLATTIPAAKHYNALTGTAQRRASKRTALGALRQHLSGSVNTTYLGVLAAASSYNEYVTPITVGNQNVGALFTGGRFSERTDAARSSRSSSTRARRTSGLLRPGSRART
jgi:hypothetical protein